MAERSACCLRTGLTELQLEITMASNDFQCKHSQVRPSVMLLLPSVGPWNSYKNSVFGILLATQSSSYLPSYWFANTKINFIRLAVPIRLCLNINAVFAFNIAIYSLLLQHSYMFRYTTETPSGCGGHFVWWQQVKYINRSPPQKYVSEVENST
jgi:hypothetical protein